MFPNEPEGVVEDEGSLYVGELGLNAEFDELEKNIRGIDGWSGNFTFNGTSLEGLSVDEFTNIIGVVPVPHEMMSNRHEYYLTNYTLSADEYDGEVRWLLVDLDFYTDESDTNDGQTDQNGEPVSADGYILTSGMTVYFKNGAYLHALGSITEAVINQKTDGSWSINWVAVHENHMFDGGWLRGEIKADYFGAMTYYSYTHMKQVPFNPPEASFDKCYVDANNAM
jgi:hypothetical protein